MKDKTKTKKRNKPTALEKAMTPNPVANTFIYVFCGLAAIICLLPLLNVLAISFSSTGAVNAKEVMFFPVDFQLDSYKMILGNKFVIGSFFNSIYRVVLGVPISTILTVTMAYPLSKPSSKYPTRRIYIGILLFCMLFNGGLVPTYILVTKWLGLKNSIWALVLPCSLPIFNIILVMNFIRGIPKNIEEATLIDGATYLQTLVRVIMPISKPVIATIVLFQFVFHWNDWFTGLIYMSDMTKYPLQTQLQASIKAPSITTLLDIKNYLSVSDRTLKAAQIFITMIPILIIYPFMQKYFASGIVLGAVKE